MNAIRFAVFKKNGAYIATSMEPAQVAPATHFNLLDLTIVTLFMMALVIVILALAIRKWIAVGNRGVDPDLATQNA